MDVNIKPLNAALGCEIVGLDLSQPLDPEIVAQIKQAFVEYGVLIARGQNFTEPEFVGFSNRIGEHESYESTLSEYLLPGHPEILVLSNIVENGKKLGVQDAGQYWHTDRSYVARPAWSSILHAKRVPFNKQGEPLGDTKFSSSIAAFKALPRQKQEDLRRRTAWHEYVFRFSKPNDSMPGVAHPVVLKHPLSGEPCLYVNAGFTQKIIGVSENESKDLLSYLYEHATKEEFVYTHKWQPGDLLMWDNYSTQHKAINNYGADDPRLMWRTTLQGFPLQ